MPAKTAIYELLTGLAVFEGTETGQRWLLSAMHRHGAAVVTLLWRILGNEQDVCDAYQQTFLMLAHYENRQKPRNVKAYLYRTAVNMAVSMLRQERIRTQSNRVLAERGASAAEPDYAGQLDAKLLSTRLRQAVSRLPEYLRNVVVLHDLAELSYSQVAELLSITPSTARVYRAKAVRLLAVWIDKKDPNG